jgi:hypothetical protein
MTITTFYISFVWVGAIYVSGNSKSGLELNLLDTGSPSSFSIAKFGVKQNTPEISQNAIDLYRGLSIQSIVGMDKLRNTSLDIRGNKVTFGSTLIPKDWVTIPMNLTKGRPTIEVLMNGKMRKLVVDTGSPVNVLFERQGSTLEYFQAAQLAYSELASGQELQLSECMIGSWKSTMISTLIERPKLTAVAMLSFPERSDVVYLPAGPSGTFEFPQGTKVIKHIPELVSYSSDSDNGKVLISREGSQTDLGTWDGILSPQSLSFNFILDFKNRKLSFDPSMSAAASMNTFFSNLTGVPFERTKGIPLSASMGTLLTVGSASASSLRRMPFSTASEVRQAIDSAIKAGSNELRILDDDGEVQTENLNISRTKRENY